MVLAPVSLDIIAPDLDSTKIESIQTQVAGHEREKF